MKTCLKCKEFYPDKPEFCNECGEELKDIVLPRSYNIHFRSMFFWFFLVFWLALFISIQIRLIFQSGENSILYVILIALESYFMIRMITLIRINLVKIVATEEGLTRQVLFPPSKKTFSWKEIKKFKFSPLKEGRTKVYFLETRSEERRVRKECRSRWSPYH